MFFKNIKEITKEWKKDIKEFLSAKSKTAKLGIIQVGDVEASNRYIRNKMKDCEEVGISAKLYKQEEDISLDQFMKVIQQVEKTNDFVIVQLPIPEPLKEALKYLDPRKDIDNLTGRSQAIACTPFGIILYLKECGFSCEGKNVLVIGRSDIVGKPLAKLLTAANATVTLAHSKTTDLSFYINHADLIISAVGKANFLDCSQINCPVIDVGINFNEEGKMVGDCFNIEGKEVTPVPGGVGLLTRCGLLYNIAVLMED